MHNTQQAAWVFRSGLVLIVLSFMGLLLAVTATGTARFAAALGYVPKIGYLVGALFDVAKAVLPVALLVLLALVLGAVGRHWPALAKLGLG